jgi:hypothetical protein
MPPITYSSRLAPPGSADPQFTACGGTAIRWKMGTDDISDVSGALKHWLDTRTHITEAR